METAEMQAVLSNGDGTVQVSTAPRPAPKGTEVLIKVRSSGLNGADLLQVRGAYPPPPGWPTDIPGLEFAGTVVELGERAAQYEIGQRVMGIAGGGGQGEFICIDQSNLVIVPDELGLEAAGGVPETFFTAYDALFNQANITLGDKVCIHGGAGGVGTSAIQLARSAGAIVTATVRDESMRKRVEGLGCRALTETEFSGSGPYDIILELVGAKNLQSNLQELQQLGRIVVIGVGAGSTSEVDLRSLMAKRGCIRGSTLRSRADSEKAVLAQNFMQHVNPSFSSGEITPIVDRYFNHIDASEAYKYFKRGGKFGKVILTWPS